jgi:hypothetical protein
MAVWVTVPAAVAVRPDSFPAVITIPSSSTELDSLLAKAAVYCDKLEKAAFHYFCNEDIREVYNKYPTYRDYRQKRNQNRFDQTVRRYLYDYQILKKDETVKERRVLTEKNGKKVHVENAPLYTKFAYSYRSFYGPVTLLARERQPFFKYKVVRGYKENGKDIVVLEAVPRKNAPRKYNFGKVWLDKVSGAVLRIEVDNKSIDGYDSLKRFARKYGASPTLVVRHNYDVEHLGLLYPGKTEFIESYTGGANLRRKFRDGRYVRSHTTFLYKNYLFFNVEVNMKIDN